MYLCGWVCPVLLLSLPWEDHAPGNPLVPGEWERQGTDLNQTHGQELITALDQLSSSQTTTRVRNQSLICMPLF